VALSLPVNADRYLRGASADEVLCRLFMGATASKRKTCSIHFWRFLGADNPSTWILHHSCDLGALPSRRYTVAVLVQFRAMYSSAEYCNEMKNDSARRSASLLSLSRS